MSFSKNLDFLLNVTNTPNNVLARHLSLDPSYISRLRRGERSAPHEDYIRMIAVFFPAMHGTIHPVRTEHRDEQSVYQYSHGSGGII